MIQTYNENCLVALQRLQDKSVDLIVTDPPYNFAEKGGGFFAEYKSTRRNYLDTLRKANCCNFEPSLIMDIVRQKMKRFYGYFFCNKTLIDEYIRFAKDNSYKYDILVMAKTNPIPAYNNHHLSDLEYIILIRENGTYFSKHKQIDDFRKFYLTSCKPGLHPAEKPLALIERFIKISSQQNDVILDPYMGSGTTGVACINLNRNFIGMENNEKYYRIAVKRINDAQKDKLERLPIDMDF